MKIKKESKGEKESAFNRQRKRKKREESRPWSSVERREERGKEKEGLRT